MLSASATAIVDATLPHVRAHGVEITGNFYQRMFAAHPELLNLFNRGNQATGGQRQALAASVVAYAEHLTGASRLPWTPILDRIAHKHASLGISPTQYPIVGRHLLAAVADVLGAAVTAEVAAAWDEVYWLFACELIAREARLYHTVGVEDPAAIWRGWRVVERVTETPDVISLTLVPADGGPVPDFVPGQYVSVAVDLGGTRDRQIRQYSLSGRPGAADWQITVKRIRGTAGRPDGTVSTVLHERVGVGDVLDLSPPFGDVNALAGTGPVVLISAGIGLTPAMSALEHLAATAPQRPVTVVHADRTGQAHALRRHLRRLTDAMPQLDLHLWYEDGCPEPGIPGRARAGLVDPELIPVPADGYVHLCGPLPFMQLVRGSLIRRGVPTEHIGYEVFGPDLLRSGQR